MISMVRVAFEEYKNNEYANVRLHIRQWKTTKPLDMDYNTCQGYLLLHLHYDIILEHIQQIMDENKELSMKHQQRILEVSISLVAERLREMGVNYKLDAEQTIWPGGKTFGEDLTKVRTRGRRGKPMKKDMDKLFTNVCLEVKEKRGAEMMARKYESKHVFERQEMFHRNNWLFSIRKG